MAQIELKFVMIQKQLEQKPKHRIEWNEIVVINIYKYLIENASLNQKLKFHVVNCSQLLIFDLWKAII